METGEPIIYTGPTDKRLGLRHLAIYAGAYPEYLRDRIKSNPALENFFVPISRYARTAQPSQTSTGSISTPFARGGALPRRQIGPPIKQRR